MGQGCRIYYVIAERLSARHLIPLGMYVCMYICPSRSSTHAREGGGGVTRERTCAIRLSSRVGWMAEVRLKETEERLQHLQQCVPVSTPDQTPGPSLFTCVSICYVPSILSSSHNVIYCARHMSAHSAYN